MSTDLAAESDFFAMAPEGVAVEEQLPRLKGPAGSELQVVERFFELRGVMRSRGLELRSLVLAAHGGEVSLVEITEDNYAVLRFGGGCQGCSAVDITLKDGVEKTLMEQLPQLAGVRDMTDHTDRSNAYY